MLNTCAKYYVMSYQQEIVGDYFLLAHPVMHPAQHLVGHRSMTSKCILSMIQNHTLPHAMSPILLVCYAVLVLLAVVDSQ